MESKYLRLGILTTRTSLGLVLLSHSVYLKLFVFTLPGTAQFFVSLGLPAVSAYLVFAVEALAGIALIVGYQTRIAAISVIPILLGATWAHAANGWLFTNTGGGWEYPLFLTAAATALVFFESALVTNPGSSRPSHTSEVSS